jgi:hypothetical protein
MRVWRIAADRQLVLFLAGEETSGRWDGLPADVQAKVLTLLAKMIAKSVLDAGTPARQRRVLS